MDEQESALRREVDGKTYLFMHLGWTGLATILQKFFRLSVAAHRKYFII